MSDNQTTGTDKPPTTALCPCHGSENCPTGYHENVVDDTKNQTATPN